MGIHVEFNPDLALRDFSEFTKGNRKKEECIPERLEPSRIYDFLKQGQRNYWIEGEIPLLVTDGKNLSKPIASIIILEATHLLLNGNIWTKGKYRVVEVFKDKDIHFDGFAKVK